MCHSYELCRYQTFHLNMVIADVLVPNRHQDISKHQADPTVISLAEMQLAHQNTLAFESQPGENDR